jgi:hypothetical protein
MGEIEVAIGAREVPTESGMTMNVAKVITGMSECTKSNTSLRLLNSCLKISDAMSKVGAPHEGNYRGSA